MSDVLLLSLLTFCLVGNCCMALLNAWLRIYPMVALNVIGALLALVGLTMF